MKEALLSLLTKSYMYYLNSEILCPYQMKPRIFLVHVINVIFLFWMFSEV